LNSGDLEKEKQIFFALKKVRLDTSIAEHEILVKTIYKLFTKDENCRLIGSHWQDIGF
jgi:hypothetical protein